MKERTIYALGFFDGVHVGHQALLSACRELAARHGAKPGAVTFSSHPDTLVLGTTPPLINTLQDREKLLRHYGMETVVSLPFDRDMMEKPWQDFFRMLREDLQAAGLVCGADFTFGRYGAGKPELLQRACREAGIPCVVVPEQKIDGITVSSTQIRALLEAGDVARANAFLGHPHMLSGTVVTGRQLGRTIGIPTANLLLPEGLVQMRLGVYACVAELCGQKHMAVTNVGVRPTVGGGSVTVEPWILDFQENVYGRPMKLWFYQFIRPEKKFPDLGALQTEIRKNALQVREIFERQR